MRGNEQTVPAGAENIKPLNGMLKGAQMGENQTEQASSNTLSIGERTAKNGENTAVKEQADGEVAQ